MTTASTGFPLRIGSDHPSLPGHFPGRPVVPGVVILDAVQAALAAHLGRAPRLQRLPQVKFVAPLLPEQDACIELDGAAPRWRFWVLRAGVLLASGELVEAS